VSRVPVIIIYNRLFERFEIWDMRGSRVSAKTFWLAQDFVKQSLYIEEVYINSKIGRQILSKIGVRR
jgi:hypothetical protein